MFSSKMSRISVEEFFFQNRLTYLKTLIPQAVWANSLKVLVMTPKMIVSKIILIIIHSVLLSMKAEMVEWWVLPLQLLSCCPLTVMAP